MIRMAQLRGGIVGATVQLVTTMLLVSSVAFFAFSVLPSDPIRNMVGVNASEEAVAQLRKEWGLDRPLRERYARYVGALVRLDLGISLATRRPAAPEILRALATTFAYVSLAVAIATLGSIGLLGLGALGPHRLRAHLLRAADLGTSLPSIVVATVVGVLFVRLGAFSMNSPTSLLGILTVALVVSFHPTLALTQLALRASEIALAAPSTTALRSFGFRESRVFLMSVLRPALSPWFGHLSNTAAALVTGSVVIEAVFSIPGLGHLLTRSILLVDLPMMQGIVIVSVAAFLLIDLGTRVIGRRVVGRVVR